MQSALIKNQSAQTEAQPIHPLFSTLACFFALALLLAASAFAIHLEVIHTGGNVGEHSVVEYLQELYLLIVGSLFTAVAVKRNEQRGFAILVAGFFFLLLIRELDALFDQIVHGFWKYPAWVIAMGAIGYALRNQNTTVAPLLGYFNHKSFAMMMAGMATLLVFSRLYGVGELWQTAMQTHYIRTVKDLAEEGVELLAYSLVMFAAAWYCLPELLKKTKS